MEAFIGISPTNRAYCDKDFTGFRNSKNFKSYMSQQYTEAKQQDEE
jgi:hypothetical protein